MRVKTDQGEDVNQEMFYSDYQDAKDPTDKEKKKVLFKVPMKILIQRDGQTYVDSENVEYSVAEKLDEKLFEKP
jgi:hypothetical protein